MFTLSSVVPTHWLFSTSYRSPVAGNFRSSVTCLPVTNSNVIEYSITFSPPAFISAESKYLELFAKFVERIPSSQEQVKIY